MSRRLHLFNLLFASVGYIVIRLLLTPVRIKLLTSLLDKADYGLLSLIMLSISFMLLGTSLGSLEFLLRRLPGRDPDYQYGVLKTVVSSFGSLSILLAFLGVLVLELIGPDRLGLTRWDLVAAGLLLMLNVHLAQLCYFMMGQGRYAISRLLNLANSEGWLLPLWLRWRWGGVVDVSTVLWIWVGWLAFCLVLAQWMVPAARIARARREPGQLRQILVFGIPLLPMVMGEWVFQLQDRYVLAGLMSLEKVAEYSLCFSIVWVGVSAGISVLDVLVPEFFRLRNLNPSHDAAELARDPNLRHGFTLMLRCALIVAVPITAALVFCPLPILRILSAPKFHDAAPLMVWLAPIPLLYLLGLIGGRTLIAVDRGRIVGTTTLLVAFINLGLTLSLVPVLGEHGAALSGCLSYACLAVYLGARCHFPRWISWRELKPLSLALYTLTSAGAFWLASTYLLRPGIPGSLLVLATGGVYTLGAMALFRVMTKADLHLLTHARAAKAEPAEQPSESGLPGAV